MQKNLAKIICPHRGLGVENSLEAIKAAVNTRPFMVEFDVQNVGGVLYLGHPPEINFDATIDNTLKIYRNYEVKPKIDLKCNKNWKKDIDLLLSRTNLLENQLIVNIGGDELNSTDFMKAEEYLVLSSEANLLLNIDIARYSGKTTSQIIQHINSLSRKPFSVSPMLESRFAKDIKIASDCDIQHVHFWSNSTATYSEEDLFLLFEKYSKLDFQVYFDINPGIIVQNS